MIQRIFGYKMEGNIVGLIVTEYFCLRIILTGEMLNAFRRGQTVTDDPHPWLIGEEILRERINNIKGLSRTVDCGGKGHEKAAQTISGYGKDHNWVKKSIFWDLPYWENLLLRHNIDLTSCMWRKTFLIISPTLC